MAQKTTRNELIMLPRQIPLGSRRRGVRRTALVLFVTGILSFAGLSIGTVQSVQAGGPTATAEFLSGSVTGKSGSGIQINNKNYGLHKKVTVEDNEGYPRSLKELEVDSQVKFHLKKGKIDKIILVLPR